MTQAQRRSQPIGKVFIPEARLAFVTSSQYGDLFTARGDTNDSSKPSRPAYGVTLILDRNHKALPAIQKAMIDVANAKWGIDGPKTLQALIAANRVCLRDGNAKAEFPGFAGNLFISARNYNRPQFFNGEPREITLEEAKASGLFYSGCYANVVLFIWAQQNANGKRINAQLGAVQFARHGERLDGGGVADVEDFGAVEQTAQAAAEFGTLFGSTPSDQAQSSDFSSLLGA